MTKAFVPQLLTSAFALVLSVGIGCGVEISLGAAKVNLNEPSSGTSFSANSV
jgi:hypothetical protein